MDYPANLVAAVGGGRDTVDEEVAHALSEMEMVEWMEEAVQRTLAEC